MANFELLADEGRAVKIIPMPGDGSCLFYSLSYHIFGNKDRANEVRQNIVNYIASNWMDFGPFTMKSNGDAYTCPEEYKSSMYLHGTYGTTTEIEAASKIYPYTFKVYENKRLYASFGDNEEIKRLRFSGNLNSGHFDVYEEILEFLKPCTVVIKKLTDTEILNYNEEPRTKKTCDRPVEKFILAKTNKNQPSKNKPSGRPVKKITNTVKKNNHCKAVMRYDAANKKDVQLRKSKHQIANPELTRVRVNRYKKKNQTQVITSNQNRAVPTNLRKIKLIGMLNSNEDLKNIQPLRLKYSLLNNKTYICPSCGARLFEEEKSRKMWCCGQGKYNVHPLGPLNANFYEDNNFLKDARAYNNIFSFSALGTTHGFKGPPDGRGPSFVKVQGRIYHRVFDLSYKDSVNNTALYIYDGEEHKKLGLKRGLNPNLINQIRTYLNNNNPLINKLHLLNSHPSSVARLVFENTSRSTHGPVLGDMPIANEIAALIKTSERCTPREVAVWKIGESKPHNVNYLHPAYEALQYPLIFPTAPERWSIELKDKDDKKLSQVKYYRCQLLSEERFAKLRRLSQEYLVDMWCRTEEERLQYWKHNQTKLRIATRKEIDETIEGEGGVRAGKTYLPASFTHGPRYMQVKYHDAMAIVTQLGKPSFFLTVTCNPRWSEITESLYPGQQPIDRPDLCVRVFNLKLAKLVQLLKSGKVFGKIISYLHVIEFQKRGLPHAHIAFRVEGGGPVDNIEIDKYIRASIPLEEETKLRQLVLQHMVHGPCGNEKSPCFDKTEKKCSKRFPKPYSNTTFTDEKGFVSYKRPVSETPVIVGNRIVTAEWIVPYNPAVLLLMECHSNLELASTVKVVKYLYKYLHKGPDHATVGIENENRGDEIEAYAKYRYVSASDAVWRIFEFDISSRHPNVISLPIHLPFEDSIIFRPGQESIAKENSISKLTIYMTRPLTPELDECTYTDFYKKFNVDTQARPNAIVEVLAHASGKHFITKRVRGDCIARIVFVSPTLGELFYLRMLLLRIPCRSFEQLKTVKGVLYDTYQKAAFELGLLNENTEYDAAIQEAAGFKTGSALRQLFFALIMDGAPALLLWEKYCDYLCEDFHRGAQTEKDAAFDRGIQEIERMLRAHGRALSDFALPNTRHSVTELQREINLNLNDEPTRIAMEWELKLNTQQKKIYDKITSLAENNSDDVSLIFIDGPAGTGKTVLLNVIAAKLRITGYIVLCTATTGIAALNHERGVTAHSMFKLPLDFEDGNASWGISNNSQRAALIRQAKLIIIDEAPMAHRHILEIIDRGLRDLMQIDKAFGSKVIVLAGDFRQIPPIIPGGTPEDVLRATIRSSYLWDYVQIYELNENQRAKDDPEFCRFILDVGEDKIKKNENDLIELQNINYLHNLKDLIKTVYPEMYINSPENIFKRAILSGTNENIKEINDIVLELINGPVIHCFSADSIEKQTKNTAEQLEVNFLNTVSVPGVPDHDLKLKIGAIIILIRNISFTHKLVNGTKLIVDQVTKFTILAHHTNGNETVVIPRIMFKFTIGRNGMEMTRRQFPIKLAYGMTINKSQGQTLECVGVDLRSDVFSHGQLYVAIGRVQHSQNLHVLIPKERVQMNYALTKNIVYRSLLR